MVRSCSCLPYNSACKKNVVEDEQSEEQIQIANWMLDIIRSHRKNNLVSEEKCQMTPTTSGYDNILGSAETAVDPVKELSLSPSESKILPCIVRGILT